MVIVLTVKMIFFPIKQNTSFSLFFEITDYRFLDVKNCRSRARIITKAQPKKLSHKYGIQSNHQPKTTIVWVIIAAIKTDLAPTFLKKKASKKIPKTLP